MKRKASLGFSSLAALMTIWCEVPLGQKGTICSVVEMGRGEGGGGVTCRLSFGSRAPPSNSVYTRVYVHYHP